jgi:hypothetical protein
MTARFSRTYRRQGTSMLTADDGQMISDEQRRAIFLALVETQDGGTPVAASRDAVAERFRVTERQVRAIEREGIDGNWPPL